jgi:hypothetical protein
LLRHFLLLALACAIAGSWVSVGAAQPEGQLPGVMLISLSDVGDTFDFEFNCNADGSGTANYSVTGRAINVLTAASKRLGRLPSTAPNG